MLLLDGVLFGFKQVAMDFWKEFQKACKQIGNSWTRTDPCLYYNQGHGCLVVWLSWIDYNLYLVNKNGVEIQCRENVQTIDCMEEGEMKKYVKCKMVLNQARWYNKYLVKVLKINLRY